MKKMKKILVMRYIKKVNVLGLMQQFNKENDENSTLLHRDDMTTINLGALIAIDDIYVQLDESMFTNDDLSNEE